jgi:uracil-DNA glycosylase
MQFMDSILTANSEWHPLLQQAVSKMDSDYIKQINNNIDWLPKIPQLFAAFSQPLSKTTYILLGESPYPRLASANGYAFWDNSINSIWSPTGLSKPVNRATSLRNLVKMFLYSRGNLTNNMSQQAIAELDKSPYLQTVPELFQAFLAHGFLLLNASLIYSEGRVLYHAKQWRPFIDSLFKQILKFNSSIQIILLGRVSKNFSDAGFISKIEAEHPYNISFITNPEINKFFQPLDLIGAKNKNG